MGREKEKLRLPKIVVIGGGTGLSVMLRGLKEKPLHITAIVTVADDGGSSGRLRDELHIPPPGDIRNVLTALADAEPMLSKVLQYRFSNGVGISGHSLGNLMLAAMKEITGDFVTGVKELSRVLAVRGQVLPSAAEAIVMKAEMDDGTIVVGESNIPKVRKKIKRVFLEDADQITPLPEAIEALQEADAIVVGPGSLYTSLIPNLLVPKISETILESSALKVFICNVMTQPGETDYYCVSDHLHAVESHVGARLFDAVIVNNAPIPADVLQKYAKQGAAVVEPDLKKVEAEGYRIISDDFIHFQNYLRHNTDRLSEHIYRLVQDVVAKKG